MPYLMSGGTDAKSFSTLGMRCFGFSPLLLPADLDFMALFHGIDERVPIEGLTVRRARAGPASSPNLLSRARLCRMPRCEAARVLLADVVAASAAVGATSSRLAKIAPRSPSCCARRGSGRCRQSSSSWLAGELPQRQIGVGWAALRSVPEPAAEPSA